MRCLFQLAAPLAGNFSVEYHHLERGMMGVLLGYLDYSKLPISYQQLPRSSSETNELEVDLHMNSVVLCS